MDKIKNIFQNMSLKKSLISLAVLCLSVVSVLAVITILTFSNIRQNILDTRPFHISDYTVETPDENINGLLLNPQEYSRGNLSPQNQFYYYLATICMVAFPVVYIVIGSVCMAKFYYRLKIHIPLNKLRKGMEYIARQDLDFQLEYHSNDELGKLCDTFEYMKDEIYISNRKMWEILQERKALTASVSHDLRTPITVINGYLDYLTKVLKKGTVTETILQSTLGNMTIAVERLERYVDCVKDIQKIEDIEIKKEYFDLKEYIVKISKDFSLLAQQKKISLEIQDLIKTKNIETDKYMLSKILENIFDNALRFSVSRIIFTISEDEDYLLFSFQDDGEGFTEEELASATSFFYSSPTNKGNFGIGLSISRILCEKLGGILRLENMPDHGANITVKIKKS